MKYLFTLTILILSNIAFSQNYLESNPEWTERSVSCGGGNPYCISHEYDIKLEDDTTINSIVYYKTRRQGIRTKWDWTVDTLVSEDPIDDYLFPIREDQGRFYIYHTSQDEDQLLHDFNLSIGDTAVANCQNHQIVMEIDTIYFGSQMRKKFIFRPELTFGTSPLYEGIGTSRGLFVRPCSGVVGIESGSSLYCYTTNEETIQLDTFGQCETTMPVSTKSQIINELDVYPNPFNDRLVIENNWKNSSGFELKIYDFHGSLVKTMSLDCLEDSIEISTNDLVSGMYILLIHGGGKVQTSKIMKI